MKRILPFLLLLAAAGLLFLGLSLGCDGLAHSRENGVTLWEPPPNQMRKVPAVVLCGGDRGTAIELARRGYVVAVCSPGKVESAYTLLCQQEQIDRYSIALIGWGKSACEAVSSYDRALSATEYPPWALILRGEAADSEGLSNVLNIVGREETALSGYFAEGTARKTLPVRSKRANLIECIEWLGSSLGHPRDGVLADDQFVFPFSALCCYAAGVCAGLTGFLMGKGKKNAERMG